MRLIQLWLLLGLLTCLYLVSGGHTQTKELGPRDYPLQSCTAAPASGFVRQCADTVTGNLICLNSSGGSCNAGVSIGASGLTVGSLYYQAAGGLTLARANASATLPAICLAVTATQCTTSGIYQFGVSQSWTVGTVLYVSDATAGAILTTAPTASGSFVQRVGIALASGTILLAPSIDVGGIQ